MRPSAAECKTCRVNLKSLILVTVSCFTLLVGCSMSNSPNVQTPTTAATPRTTAQSAISADSRVSPSTQLAPLDACRIADATPDNGMDDPTRISSLGFPRRTTYAGSLASVRLFALPVGFADLPYTQQDYDALIEAMGDVVTYYSRMSFGRARIDVAVAPYELVVNLPDSAKKYNLYSPDGFADSNGVTSKAIRMADPSLNVGAYDVVVVETPRDPAATFWPQALPLSTPIATAGGDVTDVVWTGGWQAGNWRSIAHETGHLWLGLEDLYDTTPNSTKYDGTFWEWDLMNSFRGASPELTAWSRFLLGWLNDDQVRCIAEGSVRETTHFISPIEDAEASPKAIVRPLDKGRVLVIETRRIRGYDEGRPGVLVYVMDSTKRSGDGPAIAKGELSLDPARMPISDRYTIPVGKSLETEGLFIELLASDETGDVIRVTRP